MLERLASRKDMPWLKKCDVGCRENPFCKSRTHQGAVIRDITDRRFAFTFWTLDITVFGVIAGYNNALVGTAVVDFSDTSGVIAVHDAF
jgi:hypothetical protein